MGDKTTGGAIIARMLKQEGVEKFFGIIDGTYTQLFKNCVDMGMQMIPPRHESIAAAAPINGERAVGWVVHYLIGIAYAAILVVVAGHAWLQQPRLIPALLVGVATVAAPLLLMQPAMGAGIAARRTTHPWQIRIHSVLMHTVFGLGLYLTGLGLQLLRGH